MHVALFNFSQQRLDFFICIANEVANCDLEESSLEVTFCDLKISFSLDITFCDFRYSNLCNFCTDC